MPRDFMLAPRCTRVLALFVIILGWGGVSGNRPEGLLAEFLSRPFAPSDWGSEECLKHSAIYLKELKNYTPWALQMYDASVKIPSGVITGNYRVLGNYDECLQVLSGHGFVGQACSATVQFDISEDDGKSREPDLGDLLLSVAIVSNATNWTHGKTVGYSWMWCVPSSCNHTEIQEALELALDPLKVDGRVDMIVTVPKEACHTIETDRRDFQIDDCIYICILGIFAVLIIASTSYDISTQGHLRTLNRKDTRYTILTSFSLRTNGKNLLSTSRDRNSIGCLDGLRFLSICWIIFGHTYYAETISRKINLSEVPRMHLSWSNMFILNGNIATDTFFLLSGTLLAYTEMSRKSKQANWRFDVIGLYVHRYLRVTPAYAMMIGFYATIFYKFGTGPEWNSFVGANRDYCRKNWWTNLLYVNNYVNVAEMCMAQSWYLAADMQLIWLSPIFLYPMLKFTRGFFFWLVFLGALFLSILVPFLITFFLNLSGTMLYYKDLMMVGEVYQQIYTRIYCRFGTYVIGLALGYVLYKTRTRPVKIPSYCVICGWILALLVGFLVIFGPRAMYFDDHVYNRLEASFYAGFHRQAFVLATSWIIFCSVHGYGGIVDQFLSWRGWIPLSRLTYCAYLCHYVFILSEHGVARSATMLSQMGAVRTYFGDLCLTMFLAVLWSLCFEIPFLTLSRALITRRRYQCGLSGKQAQGAIFGSTDSSKEIYRSTEETSSTTSQVYENEAQGKSNESIYKSVEGINQQNVDEKDSCGTNVERTKSKNIFVISPRGNVDRSSTWPRINVNGDGFVTGSNLKDGLEKDFEGGPRGKLEEEPCGKLEEGFYENSRISIDREAADTKDESSCRSGRPKDR